MISLGQDLPAVRIRRGGRLGLAVGLDALLAASSLLVAVVLRVGTIETPELVEALSVATPMFAVIATATFMAMGLYGNVWRYASVPDLLAIIKAATIAVVLFVVAMFMLTRIEAIPRSTPLIQWFVLIIMLGGVRLSRRMDRGAARPRAVAAGGEGIPVLLAGAGDDAYGFLKALARDAAAPYAPVGILASEPGYVGRKLCGVPVLGTCAELDRVVGGLTRHGQRPRHLILAESAAKLGGTVVQDLVRDGEAMGLAVSRLPAATELRRPQDGHIELRPVELVDLLTRPQAVLDRARLDRLVEGRRVLVTGAGGTIGGELATQIAALRPAELILVEFGEFNLYSIDLALREAFPDVPRVLHLCNIRERERVMQLFERHRPELVFHAAALKHVPMVEINPSEGALTNVAGTRNVADAAARHGALAMVQVSSDKAVNPTSVMGASKRLAELYCQALDLRGEGDPAAPRFMTVRFGNVLGSSGSLIPLFERQLRGGGPLTVTHPDIKRYFMTVREAVELVLQASAHGLQGRAGVGELFVLDMGEPVKIVDIARRMIRLAGLVPDRDVRIEIVGLRPGEKLYEELFDAAEERLPAHTPGILGARPSPIRLETLNAAFDRLEHAARDGDAAAVRGLIAELLPSYRPAAEAAAAAVAGHAVA